LYNIDKLKTIYDTVFNASKASETEILFEEYESSTTRFSSNIITQNTFQKNKSLTIKVINNDSIGLAETNDLNDKVLLNTLNKAIQSANVQVSDSDIITLPGPQKYKEIDNFNERAAFLSPKEKVEHIRNATQKANNSKLNAAGIFSNGWKAHSIANSKGLFAYQKYSLVDFNLSIENSDMSGWHEGSSYKLDNIHVDNIIEKAIDIAIRSKNPISLDPGDYTVILSPEAVGELLYFLAIDGLNTRGIVEKANYFHDKLGQKVFSEKISIHDDAYHELSGGLFFDFEGMPRKKVNLIEKGVFKELVLDLRLGEEYDMPSTGHSLHQPNPYGPLALNLVMEKGNKSIDEMIQSTNHGLFVNRFHYTNILDPMTLKLTGMTRDGLFLIEKGKITKPVKNFRFTESLISAFNEIDSIENNSTVIRAFFGGGFVVSGMKINKFHFSSKTDF